MRLAGKQCCSVAHFAVGVVALTVLVASIQVRQWMRVSRPLHSQELLLYSQRGREAQATAPRARGRDGAR